MGEHLGNRPRFGMLPLGYRVYFPHLIDRLSSEKVLELAEVKAMLS